MNMRNKIIIGLSAIFFISSCGKKQGEQKTEVSEEIELRMNLKKGATYDMKMVMVSDAEVSMLGQTVSSSSEMEMVMDYEVTDVLPNGNMQIRTTYKSAKGNGSSKMGGTPMGMDFSF